jgi:hypothetical protein
VLVEHEDQKNILVLVYPNQLTVRPIR